MQTATAPATLPAPLAKALLGATGFGWIKCSARTACALVDAGLAVLDEGTDRFVQGRPTGVRITTEGRDAQSALLQAERGTRF